MSTMCTNRLSWSATIAVWMIVFVMVGMAIIVDTRFYTAIPIGTARALTNLTYAVAVVGVIVRSGPAMGRPNVDTFAATPVKPVANRAFVGSTNATVVIRIPLIIDGAARISVG